MADQSNIGGVGGAWMRTLICSEDGEPRPLLANAIMALRTAPEWAGRLWFDVFNQRAVARGAVPWSRDGAERVWDDDCDRRACEWLQGVPRICVPTKTVTEAVDTVAREQRFHPVIDYLHRYRWDGAPQLDEWALRYLGAQDNKYCRAVASRWMISAVARVMDPGCKADCALILEGEQGTLKSSAIRVLAAPWFTDEISEFGSKDAAVQLAGAWIIELAELSSMRAANTDRIKAFMARQTDRYRPPYGRRVIEQPRQCIFVGTVNDDQYLPDETGNRRFWPIKCGRIDIDGLRNARDQLWAEARDRFLAGEVWYLDTPELNALAAAEQAMRHQPDAWQEPIEEWLASHVDTSINEILRDALYITTDKLDQRSANRVARCLKVADWGRFRVREGKVLRWRYRSKPAVLSVPSMGEESGNRI
jgi:predicted P-loop ATPase